MLPLFEAWLKPKSHRLFDYIFFLVDQQFRILNNKSKMFISHTFQLFSVCVSFDVFCLLHIHCTYLMCLMYSTLVYRYIIECNDLPTAYATNMENKAWLWIYIFIYASVQYPLGNFPFHNSVNYAPDTSWYFCYFFVLFHYVRMMHNSILANKHPVQNIIALNCKFLNRNIKKTKLKQQKSRSSKISCCIYHRFHFTI